MTHIRRPLGTRTPARTGGEDRPAPACENRLDLVEGVYNRGAVAHRAYPHLMELCAGCPLQAACWADEEWRDALKAAALPKVEACGTYSGWTEHRRRGTKVCEPCRKARNDYQRAHRAKGRAA